MSNILVCDDDKDIVEAIEIYLEQDGYTVIKAYDGMEALETLKKQEVQLLLIDIMMPGLDGIRVVKKLREEAVNIPVIFLSAKSEDSDKVIGLNIGADDYITKPFNPLELLARVKSALRRYTTLGSMEIRESVIKNGGLELDTDTREVKVEGEVIRLTPIEYNILELLMRNAGKVYSSTQIYESIWSEEACGADNTVAVHIRHIREKVEIDPANPRYIKVVWGVGYKVERYD